MDFIASEADVPAPQFIQISGEIVVGIVMEGGKKSYSLQNLLFDRVSVSSY
jgi:hypothetical protein